MSKVKPILIACYFTYTDDKNPILHNIYANSSKDAWKKLNAFIQKNSNLPRVDFSVYPENLYNFKRSVYRNKTEDMMVYMERNGASHDFDKTIGNYKNIWSM